VLEKDEWGCRRVRGGKRREKGEIGGGGEVTAREEGGGRRGAGEEGWGKGGVGEGGGS